MASCSQNPTSPYPFAFSDKQKNPYASGKAKMAAGHYGLAVESFRKALAKEPGSVKALNALAAAYDLLGRFDLAERYYRQALILDPKSVQSLNNLGYSYYLRGEYGQARSLFERAAAIDGKNPVVVANLASLENAQMKQQVAAAAKQRSKTAGAKTLAPPSQAVWIERSNRVVQTLVTKPDPALVKAARERDVEPRIVHSPKPVIEIATTAPVKMDAEKPASAPVVAAVGSKRAILMVEPKASRTEPAKLINPAEVEATPRIAEKPASVPVVAAIDSKPAILTVTTKAPRREPTLDVVVTVPVIAPKAEVTMSVEPKSYALVGSPARTPVVNRDISGLEITGTPTAGLPKLNQDVARDVLAVTAATETSVSAKSTTPVPPPLDPLSVAVKTPDLDQMDRPVDIAVLVGAAPAKSIAPVLPPVDTVPAAVKAPDPEKVDRPAAIAAPTGKTETADPAKVDPVPATAKAPEKADQQVNTAALATKMEPTRKVSGKEKMTSKDTANQIAALKKAGRIEISNGAGRLNMAARMGRYLVGHGMPSFRLTNAKSFTNKVSVLYFKPGQIAHAKSLSGVLPVHPSLRRNAALETDLRLVLGGDMLNFDRTLISKSK
jgi:hypothetical protein